jgi:hypothetical protein
MHTLNKQITVEILNSDKLDETASVLSRPMIPKFPRVLKQKAAWTKYNASEEHLHFRPFAILPERQEDCSGSFLLIYFCEVPYIETLPSYFETDKKKKWREPE